MNRKNMLVTAAQLFLLGIIDGAAFFFGNNLELFEILQYTGNAYQINYGRYACFLGLVGYNVLTIYHIFIKNAIQAIVSHIDQNGSVRKDLGRVKEGIKKVEAHLINYDSNSIEFNYLSAIEAEVGVTKQSIHNEIWVLTNNFEESNDSEEAIELRTAIKNNLLSNVDYYYVIPNSKDNDMKELINKLEKELENINISGSLKYITDDALDFIPTSYFDIVMYFRISEETGHIDKSSEVYYCFSRDNMPENEKMFFYQKVTENEIMDKLKERTREYKMKNESSFKVAIKHQ